MTTSEQFVTEPGDDAIADRATRHLWMHFTRHSTYHTGSHVPVIVRGEGARIWDDSGRSYLDGLSGLFVVQAGHGRAELAEAAARQAEQLAFFPIWSYAHPAAVDLAERLANLTPGDLNRVFFTAWGNYADNGYFWEYNSLFIGGTSAPGEKGWEIACVFVVFPMRIAAGIAFLQMKRWGHQWLIVTCWMGVVIWVGYIVNMTMYADIRFDGTILPVVGWWAFDIFYITPFLAIPYLHTVNREIFAD